MALVGEQLGTLSCVDSSLIDRAGVVILFAIDNGENVPKQCIQYLQIMKIDERASKTNDLKCQFLKCFLYILQYTQLHYQLYSFYVQSRQPNSNPCTFKQKKLYCRSNTAQYIYIYNRQTHKIQSSSSFLPNPNVLTNGVNHIVVSS